MNKRWRPSVTVAAVIEHEGRFLLVEEQTPEGLKLNNPAGHLEPGETPQAAVVREALEETAHEFVPEALLGVYMARFVRLRPPRLARTGSPGSVGERGGGPRPPEDVTYLRFAYSGRVGEPLPGRALDPAIVRTLWLTREEIAAEEAAGRLRSPLVMRCIDDHLAGRRLPLDAVSGEASLVDPVVLHALPLPALPALSRAPAGHEPAGPAGDRPSRSARRRARKKMQDMHENNTESRPATEGAAAQAEGNTPHALATSGEAASAEAMPPAGRAEPAAGLPPASGNDAGTDAGAEAFVAPSASGPGLTASPPVTEADAQSGAEAAAEAASPTSSAPASSASTDEAAPTPAPGAAPAAAKPAKPEPTLAETAAALAERFPALFSPGEARPIKLRIQADIQARTQGAFTRKQLSIFLHRHTTSTAYLRALVASPQRFDLDGQPAGEVAAEHVEAAKVELERRRQIVQQRRAQQGGRPARPGAAGGPVADAGAQTQGAPGAPGTAGVEGSGGAPRGDRPPRPPRPPRPEGAGRPDRPGRPGAGPGPGPRPAGAGHGDRPPRGDRPARPGSTDLRPPRPERGDRPAGRPFDRNFDRPSERSSGRSGPPGAMRTGPGGHGGDRSPRHGDADRGESTIALPEDPVRRERAILLRSFEGSPLTAANFCALKGLALPEFEAQIALARREREERQRGG